MKQTTTILPDSNYPYPLLCGVCDEHLTQEEMSSLNLNTFTPTCNDHRNYRNHFQLDKVRAALGKPPKKVYDCEICSRHLTDGEKESIGFNHFLITCDTHREYCSYFDIRLAREKAGWKVTHK